MAAKKKTAASTAGMSDLEKKLLEENERLSKENAFLKDRLYHFREHAVDLEGETWICGDCGATATVEQGSENVPHETFCPFHKA